MSLMLPETWVKRHTCFMIMTRSKFPSFQVGIARCSNLTKFQNHLIIREVVLGLCTPVRDIQGQESPESLGLLHSCKTRVQLPNIADPHDCQFQLNPSVTKGIGTYMGYQGGSGRPPGIS